MKRGHIKPKLFFYFQELAKKGLNPPNNRKTNHECIFQCQEHGFYISKEYLAKNIYLRDDREEINFNNQEVGRKVSLQGPYGAHIADL